MGFLDINKFEKLLTAALSDGLPGEKAQYLMAPQKRLPVSFYKKQDWNPKVGAVLILFYPTEETIKTVLMVRNAYEGVHSGQVSFPGGRFEEKDIDLEKTALRETAEELGIRDLPEKTTGVLTELYIPPSNFLIKPYIAISKTTPDFNPDSREVNHIFEISVEDILNDLLVRKKQIELSSKIQVEAPYFHFHGHVVWGATAMIISELKEILKRVY